MAAPSRKLLRTAINGLHRFSTTQFCLRAPVVPYISGLPSQQCATHRRPLYCTHDPLLSSTRAETQTATEAKTANDPKHAEEEEEDDNRAEYIPKRKAKNPMTIIGYAWMVGLPTGIILFILAKRQVDKNRLKQLKIRQRMKRANEGQYRSQRYNTESGTD